ncbi:flagellar basal body L-ring protein FlgH [Marinovum sp. KMM 9879]
MSFRRYLLTLPTLALVTGCTEPVFDREPELSRLGVDQEDLTAARTVNVPMPAPEIARAPHRAERASLWGQGSDGFFADQRATNIGDLLTIVIEIDDEASLDNATRRSRSGQSAMARPGLFGYGSQIDKILPGVGPADLPSGDIVDISSETSARGDGSVDRSELISLRMAALVVQSLANGNLVVVGRQEVKVNEELRELRVSGIIRPQDIDRGNTIRYDKMAEARISYGGRGALSRQQVRGYGEDVMDVILPY